MADKNANSSSKSASPVPAFNIKDLNVEKIKALVMKNPLAFGLVGVFSLYLIFGYGADLIVTVLGFAYPAYQSVKAVESVQKDDDTQWLIYWVVFASFNIVEFFSDILLSWFPLYFLTKLIFLGWCMAPVSWNGSDTLYQKVIKPFVLRHQSQIDSTLEKVGEKMDKYAKEAKEAATEAAIRAATESGDKKDD
ncbi:receptor expression-enhancing protein 5 isoform X2 [Nematostella vectensis]|uniref:receptor expression-enhancing protein 5 isoform X2 n=1 Tax=Nematostella vectensis TaxID=45351 RepID=UPI00207775FD|nr:receptor expression-enhancing protein 5 isoform X2 [Nematostella vectensis]